MINFGPLIDAVQEAVSVGLGEGAEIVAVRARQKAPVRRIFSNRGPKVGLKSALEMESDRSVRKSLGLSVEGSRDNPNPKIVRGRIPPRRWHDRRLSRADELLADRNAAMAQTASGKTPWRTALSARGAYEVKTRRAVGRFGGHLTIGGYLRESISAEPVTRVGGQSVAWVIAAADYAKYQEYGTAHNPAHPFLRPAAMESQNEVADAVGHQISSVISRTNLGSYEIEFTVAI